MTQLDREMMKHAVLAFITMLCALVLLGACTTAPNLTPLQKLQADVTAACNIVQPTIAPFVAVSTSPAMAAFNKDVNLACATNATLDLASVQDLVGSTGTAAQQIVASLNLSAQDVALLQAAIGAFTGSLKNAILNYQASQPAQTAVPASS